MVENKTVYFTDNFFSAGATEIYTKEKTVVGVLDLKSAFSSSVVVKRKNGEIIVSGGFSFFSNKWFVKDHNEEDLGQLWERIALFSKVYEYQAFGRGVYRIESPAFSREYMLYNENDELAAQFKRVDGFFESPAFQLTDHCSELDTEELVAVVMGMNAIQKRRKAQDSNAAT